MRSYAVALLLAFAFGSTQPISAGNACDGVSSVRMAGPADAPFIVAIDLGPGGIPVSAPFGADITICPFENGRPTRVTVDATMPAHKHGMNYEPRIVARDAGRYAVEGLLFHMPGIWRFEVTAYADGKPHRFFHDVAVE